MDVVIHRWTVLPESNHFGSCSMCVASPRDVFCDTPIHHRRMCLCPAHRKQWNNKLRWKRKPTSSSLGS